MVEIEVKDSARFVKRHMNKALKRSYLKGLTEPITNSDDSYRRLQKSSANKSELCQTIEVYASPKRKQFDVVDFAEGMPHDDMIEYFREYGEEKKTHVMGGRGVFGQGLSDVMYGREQGGWVHSIKDGMYSCAQFKWKTKKENDGVLRERRIIRVPEPSRADKKTRQGLKIPQGNGTQVSFKFTEAPFPSKNELVQHLSQFYMLRLINSNPSRKVIVNITDEIGGTVQEQIHYEFPQGKLLAPLSTTMNFDGSLISIEGELYRSDSPLAQSEAGENRQGGLLVYDEELSVVDLTLFGYDDDPLAVHFWGKLRLDGAHKLIRKKLQEQEELLTETRDGFVRTHSFYVKLKEIVDDWLKPFIEIERARASQKGSALTEETQRQHKKAFHMLNELYREINSDIIALPPGSTAIGNEERPDNGMQFSSDTVTLKRGMKYSVLLLIDGRVIHPETKITIRSTNPSMRVRPRSFNVAPLATLPEDEIDRHRIVLWCDSPGIKCRIIATTKGHETELMVMTIEKPQPQETTTEITLQQPMEFQPSQVRRKPGIQGELHLFVDYKHIPKNATIHLRSTNERIKLEKTQVSPENGMQLSPTVCRIDIPFVCYSEGQSGTIAANYQDLHAEAEIRITSLEGLGDLFVDWDYREISAVFQAYFEKETGLVILNSTHPVNRQYFGSEKLQAHEAVESLPHCQMLLATLILDVCLWFTYNEAYRNNKIQLRDAKNPHIEIQRYIEESKFKLGRDFLSKFIKQSTGALNATRLPERSEESAIQAQSS